MAEVGPWFDRRFYHHSYARGTGRGPHRASLQALAWTRRFQWRLALDVSRYFLSIHRPTLWALFAERIVDPPTIALISRLLEHGGRVYTSSLARRGLGLDARPAPPDAGLPVGTLLSQFSGALYLDGLDQFVKRTLKIPGYGRYMDDFVLFSDDRGQLIEAKAAIEAWLATHRRLGLKDGVGAVAARQVPWVFLGYRITPGGLAASKKLRRRMRARLQAAQRAGPEALARSIAAYRGLLTF